MALLAEAIPASSFFLGAEVWLDGFVFFNPLEQRVLRAIFQTAARVHITLPLDPNMAERPSLLFYRAQKTLAALQKVCDSKDERDSKLACTKLACESGESRECLNAAKYYQVLLVGGVAASALFQKSCDERGGMDCLYAKFFAKADEMGITKEYSRKMKMYLKKACDAGEKDGCKEFEKLREL